MKKFTLIALALSVMGILMAGCSGGDAGTTTGDAGKTTAGAEGAKTGETGK